MIWSWIPSVWLDTFTEWGGQAEKWVQLPQVMSSFNSWQRKRVYPPTLPLLIPVSGPQGCTLDGTECFKSMLHLHEKGWLLKRSQLQFAKVYLDLVHTFWMPLSSCNHISEIGWLPSAEHCSSYNLKSRFVLAPCQRYDRQIMTSGRIDLFNFSDWLFGKQ